MNPNSILNYYSNSREISKFSKFLFNNNNNNEIIKLTHYFQLISKLILKLTKGLFK